MSGLRLRVTRVLHVSALWQETFTTALTPPRETGATGFSAHPRTETVLIFPGALGAL